LAVGGAENLNRRFAVGADNRNGKSFVFHRNNSSFI
jgi:hypothetical protein